VNMHSAPSGPKAGPLDGLLFKIAGVDAETLRRCPQHDWDNARAVAEILIATWLYQVGVFSLVGHRLFAESGQIRVELIAVAAFIASFVLLIDSYMVMRSGWHLSGIAELKRGGVDVSGGIGARIKAGVFLSIRILLSVGIAQLTAIFVSLLIFGDDIRSQSEAAYLKANDGLIHEATALVDGDIQRATDALNTQSDRVAALGRQLSTLRQNEIDPSLNDPQVQEAQKELDQLLAEKARADDALQSTESFATNELGGIKGAPGNSGHPGDGPRHKAALEAVTNAKHHAQELTDALVAARARLEHGRQQATSASQTTKQESLARVPDFEASLGAENAKLATLQEHLANLTRDRDTTIRKAIEQAPNFVPRDTGLLSQIKALEVIATDDPKIAWVIILIDLVSFGFELAAVLAKVTSYVPTTYAALLARDAYMSAVRTVEEMMQELDRSRNQGQDNLNFMAGGPLANDNRSDGFTGSIPDPMGRDGSPLQPIKRKRGRPPKSPMN
jgi:hypothetical protein